MADDADEIDVWIEKRCGKSGVSGRSAEEIAGFRMRGFHVIDGDGSADHDGRLRVGSWSVHEEVDGMWRWMAGRGFNPQSEIRNPQFIGTWWNSGDRMSRAR